jgi:hypothetical protein
MQYRALGTYGTGDPFGAAWSEVNTNSGEGILARCETNRARQGAAPTLDGVVAVVDMFAVRVRASRCRRDWALEAIVRVVN